MRIVRFLLRILRFQPYQFFLLIAANVIFYAARLCFGLILQAFFNALPEASSQGLYLLSLLGALLAITLLRAGFQLSRVRSSQTWRFALPRFVHRNLLRRMLELPGATAISGPPGELLSSLRDDTVVLCGMLGLIAINVSLVLFAIVALIILCRINLFITLFLFLPLLGVIGLGQAMKQRLNKYRRESRAATARLTGAIGEIFSAAQAIQVAGSERPALDYFDRLSEDRRVKMVRDSVLSSALQAVFSNIIGVGTGLILLLAAQPANHLKPGDLAIFISYLGSINDFAQDLGWLLAQVVQARVSLERLQRLLAGAPLDELSATDPLLMQGELAELSVPCRSEQDRLEQLEVRGLSYHHPSSGRGIEAIDLKLIRGSLTVVTGRVGSGKTTLLQTLLGLLPGEAGSITWNAQPVEQPATFFVPPRSAYTAQVPRLFSDTLKENILLGLPEVHTDIERAVRIAVLEQDISGFEAGLETPIGTRGIKLSGGQIQRTAAARMLVRDAELLVFDDLSSALDVETEQTLWQRLFATRDRTYLVVSHRKAALQRADRIILLKDGRVEDEGTLQELLERSEEMYWLWHGKSAGSTPK